MFVTRKNIQHALQPDICLQCIDLFKIENGKIQEVWTFAEQQSAEDTFWG